MTVASDIAITCGNRQHQSCRAAGGCAASRMARIAKKATAALPRRYSVAAGAYLRAHGRTRAKEFTADRNRPLIRVAAIATMATTATQPNTVHTLRCARTEERIVRTDSIALICAHCTSVNDRRECAQPLQAARSDGRTVVLIESHPWSNSLHKPLTPSAASCR